MRTTSSNPDRLRGQGTTESSGTVIRAHPTAADTAVLHVWLYKHIRLEIQLYLCECVSGAGGIIPSASVEYEEKSLYMISLPLTTMLWAGD